MRYIDCRTRELAEKNIFVLSTLRRLPPIAIPVENYARKNFGGLYKKLCIPLSHVNSLIVREY